MDICYLCNAGTVEFNAPTDVVEQCHLAFRASLSKAGLRGTARAVLSGPTCILMDAKVLPTSYPCARLGLTRGSSCHGHWAGCLACRNDHPPTTVMGCDHDVLQAFRHCRIGRKTHTVYPSALVISHAVGMPVPTCASQPGKQHQCVGDIHPQN